MHISLNKIGKTIEFFLIEILIKKVKKKNYEVKTFRGELNPPAEVINIL